MFAICFYISNLRVVEFSLGIVCFFYLHVYVLLDVFISHVLYM